jgi:hypothetical protein
LEAGVAIGEQESHLSAEDVAAYLDRRAGATRGRIEAHVAECEACRAELIAVARLLHERRRVRRWVYPAAIAAAAAVALLLLPPRFESPEPLYREPPSATTAAPVSIAPVGSVGSVARLVWSSVPSADRYRVRLFTGDGSVLWENTTSDTSLVLPTAIRLTPRVAYFWNVEARTALARWAPSDLARFTVTGPPGR